MSALDPTTILPQEQTELEQLRRRVAELERLAARHSRCEDCVGGIVKATSGLRGQPFYRELARQLGGKLEVCYAMIGEPVGEKLDRIRTLAMWTPDGLAEPVEYPTCGTPCEHVLGRTLCCYPSGVRNAFPEDHFLVEMGVESYIGFPLYDSAGKPLGLVTVMHDQPLTDVELIQDVLRLVAALVSAELERERAEDARRESEQQFRLLAENVPGVIFLIRNKPSLDVVYVNDLVEKLTGYPAREWMSGQMKPADVIHPDDFQLVADGFGRAIAEHQGFHLVYRIRHRSGECKWVESTGAPIFPTAPDQTVRLIEGFTTDITQRMEAEQRLRESEERFSKAFHAGPLAKMIARLDDGRFIEVNDHFLEMSGFTREEVIGRTKTELCMWDSPGQRETVMQNLLAHGRVVGLEVPFRTRKGELRTGRFSIELIEMRGATYQLIIAEDITRRRQDAEERNRTLSELQATLEATQDGILVVNSEGKITSYNRRFARMWHIPEEVLALRDDSAAVRHVLSQLVDPEGFVAKVQALYGDLETTSHDELLFKDGRIFERYSRPQKLGDRPVGRVWSFRDVTRERQAARDLEASERKYRGLVETSNDLIFATDRQGLFTFVNQAVRHTHGYTPTEVIGRAFTWFTHPDHVERDSAEFRKILAGESSFLYETVHMRSDGSIIHLSCNAIPLRDERGEIIGMTGTAADITRHKELEAALEQSVEEERRFKNTLAEMLRIGNALATAASVEGLCRQAVELGRSRLNFDRLSVWFLNEERTALHGTFGTDELGNTRDERSCSVALHPTTRQELLQEETFATVVGDNHPLLDDRGRLVGHGSYARVPMWDGQRIVGFVFADDLLSRRHIGEKDAEILTLYAATIGHLATRKRTEQILLETEERLRTVVTAAPIVLFALDCEGVFTISQGEGLKLLGLRPDEVVGRSVFDLYQDHPQIIADIRRALAGEALTSMVNIKEMTFETRYTPLRGPNGDLAGIIGVALDVTERLKLQKQLLQSQKLESIGTLAGGIAHDYNNMLAVVIGQASMHLRNRSLPPKVRGALKDIVTAAERGAALSHQLLAYARGGLQRPAPTELNPIIKTVVGILHRTTPPRVELSLNLPKQLPLIMADPTQIEQVVMNLCLNAIQASEPPTTIEISTQGPVTLEAKSDDAARVGAEKYILLTVRDHGCGMAPETLDRIYEPFFTTKPMGRGMGLSATLGIVESHGGRIVVQSAPGVGTTACVWLPVADESPGPAAAPAVPKRVEPPRGTETILLLDNELQIVRTLEKIFSMLGYFFVSHTDCDAAFAFLDNNAAEIDLVLTDVNMPKYSIEAVCEAIWQRCPHAPIMLISGYDKTREVENLLTRGVAGFVAKPFDLMSLAVQVREVLDRRPPRPE